MTLTELDLVFNVIAVVGTVVFGALAVQQKDLMRAVFCYAVSSAFLAVLFFLLLSPYAGVLELTVGAGLVLVLFLVALGLSMGAESEVPEKEGVKPMEGGRA